MPDWTNRQEMWDFMAQKETGMYRRLAPESFLSRHPALQPRMRTIILDWLIEVCEVYKFRRETFYLAVDFLDRFLGLSSSVSKNNLQLIAVSCLLIGVKIEETHPPDLQEFAYITNGACTPEAISNMELTILKGLNWCLTPMTPITCLGIYLQILQSSNTPNEEASSFPAYSGLPFSRFMQLQDLCMLDVGSLNFSYSVLVTSVLYHIESEEVALAVSGYRWEDIARCVHWMAPFHNAILERSQSKKFQGIQPDETDQLQTHSIDLQLLERAQELQQAHCSNVSRERTYPMTFASTALEKIPQEGEST